MEFSGLIDHYQIRRILVITIITMLLIVVILFFVLLIHKVYVELRERRFRMLKEAYIAAVSRRLFEPHYHIERPVRRIQFEALGDVIIDMLSGISGEMETKVRDIAREMGLDDYYKKRAKGRFWLRRLVAVEKLGLLKMPETKSFLYSLLENSRNNELNARAVLGL